MPLVIITGFPCSGKTYRAQQIVAEFSTRINTESSHSKKTVQIIDSHHASLDLSEDTRLESKATGLRDQIYNSAAEEKRARAEEFSAIKRAVSKDNIVIADGLNYIKGYRYQLWCEAKASGTRCCVVHVAAQEDECKRWNRERLRVWGRESEIEEQDDGILADGRKGSREKKQKDIQGDLVPESHTAIYGDRVIGKSSHSRDSSTEGRSDDDGIDLGKQKPDLETMTLKSLYIRDNQIEDENHESSPVFNNGVDTRDEIPNSTPVFPPPSPKSSHPYAPSTLSSIQMRYEPPSPFSRWDTPLFTVPSSDNHPPYDIIWTALFPLPIKSTKQKQNYTQSQTQIQNPIREKDNEEETKVKQHAATILPAATSSNALQLLESTTLEVIKEFLSQARAQDLAEGEGGILLFSIPSTTSSTNTNPNPNADANSAEGGIDMEITIPQRTKINQPMLQRIRRKYTQVQRGGIAHGRGYIGGDRRSVVERFMRFLEAEL